MKTVKGRYQIAKNIYVFCFLNILEANSKEIKTFLGFKRRAKSLVPIGTRIFFSMEAMLSSAPSEGHDSFEMYSIQVLQMEDMDGKPLHICSPIQKESRAQTRKQERREVNFPVNLVNSQAIFTALNGNNQGLTLQYTNNRAMLSLVLNQSYEFSVQHKTDEATLVGVIKHIQYDWKSHQHVIGVHFPKLATREDTILNYLIDPNYKIEISNKQTVDTSSGKISLDD